MSFVRYLISVLNGFRKFSIMVLLVNVGVVFRVTDLINGTEFVDLLKGTAIAFFASNAGEHLTNAVITWVKKK